LDDLKKQVHEKQPYNKIIIDMHACTHTCNHACTRAHTQDYKYQYQ